MELTKNQKQTKDSKGVKVERETLTGNWLSHAKAWPRAIWIGLAHLMVVYVVWGSTYLAMRLTVREGAGFPPFTMGASRLLLAGLLLLLWTWYAKKKIKLTGSEMAMLALTGVLLWIGGNGLVLWAERNVDSGFAALVVATTPIWVTMVEAVLNKKIPSFLLFASLLIGFVGTGLLTAPAIMAGQQASFWDVVALLVSAISFGMGSLIQSRKPIDADPLVCAAYQQIFGGVGFIILALLMQEPWPTPTTEAWLAWAYLVVFGSIAFTSFVYALRLLPTSIATTYAYVNPVIAVFLGWLFLGEMITSWAMGGAVLVLIGVAGVFRARYQKAT